MGKKILSVVLATYNEEKNIKNCLESVKDLADEIIVIDGSSADKTVKIAKNIGARVFKVKNQLMFHKNKQAGLEKATGDWILQLDADERVTKKLRDEIKDQIAKSQTVSAFYLPRKNYFLGHWLKKGGQYPDFVIRLVKKGKAHFPCQTVHEQIKIQGEIGYLKNPLVHLSAPDLKTYLKKAKIYTNETALELKKRKTTNTFILGFNYLVFKPIATFFNLFIRHKGLLDGFRGFLFALFSAGHHPIAYFKFLRFKA